VAVHEGRDGSLSVRASSLHGMIFGERCDCGRGGGAGATEVDFQTGKGRRGRECVARDKGQA